MRYVKGEGVTNQGRVRSDNIASREHQGLLFRSKAEVTLFIALTRAQLPVAPLPVFVRIGKFYNRLEPDFVVIYKGLTFIIEVDGDTYHRESPAEADKRLVPLTWEGVEVRRIVVRPNDPNALPIALQDMRQAFGHAREQFGADVGNANGRLDQGNLDLPPESFLLDLCLQGPEQLRETLQRQTLTGQEVWPFVATALSQQGTERPYWFLVSMVDDIGQLIGQLRRAVAVSRQDQFKERCNAAIRALEAKRQERTLAPATEIATFTVAQTAAAEAARENIPDSMDRNEGTIREASLEAAPPLAAVYAGEFTAGQAFPAVYASDNPDSKKYWTRQLLIAATDAGDRSMLITVLREPQFVNLKTDARKALRLVDILTYGPNIELG
ncbi:hypothetical protein SAMN04489798_3014 [Pseudomonas arsenicoxydans]|uniref:DUF559 domain-containing protein n=1 Tax=Pseudomonas arsenicoxydans TaxID=702115 RepID=A0A1H0JSD2_9PSED|nr:hypothetical protein [Pseudomonas arsenicoxydans]SDO46321.1 hypothetical protein SAMN04489798_3014 [Pseudomonas arsenicoxydans]